MECFSSSPFISSPSLLPSPPRHTHSGRDPTRTHSFTKRPVSISRSATAVCLTKIFRKRKQDPETQFTSCCSAAKANRGFVFESCRYAQNAQAAALGRTAAASQRVNYRLPSLLFFGERDVRENSFSQMQRHTRSCVNTKRWPAQTEPEETHTHTHTYNIHRKGQARLQWQLSHVRVMCLLNDRMQKEDRMGS